MLLPNSRSQESVLRRVGRLLMSLLTMLAFVRFARTRCPTPKEVSSVENVSSSPSGPCRLVARVLTLSNSHAGTHADTPRHFHINDSESDFPQECYTGVCHVVDLSGELPPSGSGQPRAITQTILQAAAAREGFSWRDVWRVLFITRNYRTEAAGDKWDGEFAHFDLSGAEFLAAEATHLLLVGLDTPSVDHPSQSPICHGAHGALYKHRIAILENLNLEAAQRVILSNRDSLASTVGEGSAAERPVGKAHLRGTVMTVFIPAQCFPDSKGCAVVFFPNATTTTTEH
jgi:kynurenine formamidase